ncbi:MAG TPA: prepilin-type N-terminal cleavage/methylation domain-containing protein [Tepidisphaeraceae bacterium]|nr:prepilin-type N-terminal cleavage/methylation domain-containing protein [Tepidisphaeraceae bacterium]
MFTLHTHRKLAVARASRQSRGFTLIEILMVVVILGIASAIIAPQIGSRDDLKVRAAARVLISDLIYAQNLAISQQKQIYVKFDADAENYRLMDRAGPAGLDSVIQNPITKDPFITKLGPAGGSRMSDVRIQSAVFNGVDITYSPAQTLTFDELGTPLVYRYDHNNTNEMLDGTIVLQCGVRTITVTIERYTGEITVTE